MCILPFLRMVVYILVWFTDHSGVCQYLDLFASFFFCSYIIWRAWSRFTTKEIAHKGDYFSNAEKKKGNKTKRQEGNVQVFVYPAMIFSCGYNLLYCILGSTFYERRRVKITPTSSSKVAYILIMSIFQKHDRIINQVPWHHQNTTVF